MKKRIICAYRMANVEFWRWRINRAWSQSGDAFLREAVKTQPEWPPFRQRWREWLSAYDASLKETE